MIASVLGRRVRGFRVVNVAALAIAMVMAMGVYWAKTSAAREAAAISDVQSQIAMEQRRSRLLQAEISDETIRERMRDWQAPAPHYRTGVFAKYTALVGSAARGAVTQPEL